MKKGVNLLFYGLFFVLLLSFSSAQITPGSSEDTILRISSNSNAHGEIYNGAGSYGTPILYSDLFGTVYSGNPANVHQCAVGTPPSNLVLRLYSNSNAHAQSPDYTGTAYPIDVCYGDLVCQSVSGNNNCPTNFVEVVSLSANTNAHIETQGANSYTSPTNRKICCQATSNPTIYNPRWEYADGNIIDPSTVVCPSQQITASVQTSGLANGQAVLFSFYDDDFSSPDLIAPLSTTVQNNRASITLDLTDPVIRSILQSELGGIEGDEIEFYFEAGAPSIPSVVLTSDIIIYSDDINDCSYTTPTAIINSPIEAGVYSTNSQVPFESGCSSQIGPVQTEWTIRQGTNTFTRTEASFSHTFTQPGQTNVELKCTDLNGNYDTDEIEFLVVSGEGIFAYINNPELNSIIQRDPPNSGPYFPTEVDFSASDSYVVQLTSSCSANCIGGNCPSQTENIPSGCSGTITINNPPNPDYSNMNFNWRFWDSDWSDEGTSLDGMGVNSGTIQYDDLSNGLNDKYMSVIVSYNGQSSNFERRFTLGRCFNNGNSYYDLNSQIQSTNSENNACKGGDTNPDTADDCCATGLKCLPGTTNPSLYSCQIPAGGIITSCEDYTDEIACNGNTNPSIPRESYGSNPPACTTLSCLWSAGSCGISVTTYQSTGGVCSSGPGAVVTNSCSYTTTVSECVAGRKTISYNVVSGNGCGKPDVTVPCGSLSFELSFFELRQFLLSLFVIAGIYLLFNFHKVKKHGNKK